MSSGTQRRALAAIAGALGLLAGVAGVASRSASAPDAGSRIDAASLAGEIEREADHVTARELAEWIRAGEPGLRVLDVRSDSAFAAYHIPSAERVSLSEVAEREPEKGETLVLYSEGGAHAAQAWVLLRARGHERVRFLRGGLLEWMDDVMRPVVAPGDSAAHVAALSRYFGGVPRVSPTVASPRRPATSAAAVDELVRRGC